MCWHKFGKWSNPKNSSEARAFGSFGDMRVVDVVIQERTCMKCFIVESRFVRDGTVERTKEAK